MGAIELLEKTQTTFVNSSILGVSETIVYTHKESLLKETIKVFADTNNYNKSEKGNVKTDEITFTNVILSEEPAYNDQIIYNNDTYKVKNWEYQVGKWVVYADGSTHHTGSRRRWKN